MNLDNIIRDMKIYLLSGSAFALSFTQIENGFRLFLMGISIVYTLINIYKLLTKKTDANK
jgi:hypothetical protein